jgi:hypothetical protein
MIESNREWSFWGYWNVVIGAQRIASDAVEDSGMDSPEGLESWIGHAEAEAWRVGGEGGRVPREWANYRSRALELLCVALFAKNEDGE